MLFQPVMLVFRMLGEAMVTSMVGQHWLVAIFVNRVKTTNRNMLHIPYRGQYL